jgi:two-component system sensor histidine kinase RegB
MDADTLARAEEPFFTTKEPGRGMGLGLFLAKTAAERFGGSLKLQSAKGLGTRVLLQLNLAKITGSKL